MKKMKFTEEYSNLKEKPSEEKETIIDATLTTNCTLVNETKGLNCRRARSKAINYAEPSLHKKMRRQVYCLKINLNKNA